MASNTPHLNKTGNAKSINGIHGNSDYKPEYCQMLIDHFDKPPFIIVEGTKEYYSNGELKKQGPDKVIPIRLPTYESFAHSIGTTHKTLIEWRDRHKDFGKAYARAKDLQKDIVSVNAMNGEYNAQWAQFFAKNNLDMKDKVEVESKTQGVTAVLSNVSTKDLRQLMIESENSAEYIDIEEE